MISIIVPIYKVEEYLDRCVESIVQQSYKDIEIILVDDGSPDNCPQKCDEWAKKDKRIRVIHKVNGGLSDARNVGISEAKGEWLLFVDSDDWISKDCCSNAIMAVNKWQADICIFQYKTVEQFSEMELQTNINSYIVKKNEVMKKLACEDIQDYAWNKLYKKSLFKNIKYPLGFTWEDVGTTYRLFEEANVICLTDFIGYFYFQRESSIIHVPSKKATYDIFCMRYNKYNFLKTKYPHACEAMNLFMVMTAFQFCINYCNSDEYNEMYKKAKTLALDLRKYYKAEDYKHKILFFLFLHCSNGFELLCKIKK